MIAERLERCRIIPVITLKDVEKAVPLANALLEGGIDCMEITFRTDAAEDAIKKVSQNVPEMLVIAGTVLNIENAEKAIAAGTKAIVSPGFNAEVVKYCLTANVPIIPGVMTPSEIETAMSYGLRYLKFFPAEPAGGIDMLKAFSGPYGDVKFMPTGGISAINLPSYLALKNVFAAGASFVVSQDLLERGKFDVIARKAEEATFFAGRSPREEE